MRIALLADIHGNAIALDAVLADIQREGGVDGYWVLGDLVAIGPDPAGVLERLSALQGLRVIRGNTDRYVAFGDRPGPSIAEVQADATLFKPLIQVAGTFAWTQGMVTAAGWLPWLKALPLDFEIVLPDGTRFLGVHASPGTDDGTGISPASSDQEIESAIAIAARQRIGGLLVTADPFFTNRRDQLVAIAARYSIPAIYFTREFALAGGNVTLSPNHRNTGLSDLPSQALYVEAE